MALPVGFYGSLQWIGWLSLLDEVALNHWNTHNAIIMYIINLIKDVIINSIALIFSMLFLINIDYRISLIFILVILFYIIFYKFLRKRIQVIKNKVLENRAKYYARLQDQILYAKFIKIYNFGNRLDSIKYLV